MFRLLSTIIVATTCNLFADTTLVHDNDLLDTKVYKLENGLTIYLSENKQSPNFYAEIAVRCGSVHDPQDATGIAHYLEHLMFKGSVKIGTSDFKSEQKILNQITELFEKHKAETDLQKRKEIYSEINTLSQEAAKFAITNEMDRLYKSLGSTTVNAHTSYDETVYKVELPSNRLEQWAMIESERFKQPIFRLFHTELETVYEEKNRSNDNANNLSFNALMNNLYPQLPYKNTILGAPEHLKSPSISQLYAHYKQYYTPDNMAIIISGDIDTEKAIKVIESYFSKLEPGKLKRKTFSPTDTNFDEIKRVKIPFQGEEIISMAYKTVPNNHEDIPALMMFDMLMDNNVVGLINLNLIQNQKVRHAGSWPFILNHGGSQNFYAYPREGQSLEELETLINDQIELIKEGKFEDSLLDAIRSDLKKNEELSFESNEGRVTSMRDSFISKSDWNYTVQNHSRYSKVTKADIIHVANKYFNNNYLVIHRVKGDPNITPIQKPQIDPIPVNSTELSAYASEILAKETFDISASFIEEGSQFKKNGKENSVQFISVENPMNNIFSLTWHFPKGMLHDNKIRLALDVLNISGTKKLSSEELNKKWYNLGVQIDYKESETSSIISLQGPEKSFENATELFYEWVNTFTFDENTLKKTIEDAKQTKQDMATKPDSILHAMARYRRYGGSSIYRQALSQSELDAINEKDIKQTISSLFACQHTVSYTGKKAPQIWQAQIQAKDNLAAAPTLATREVESLDTPVSIHFYHREMAQAQVWIESEAGTYAFSDEVQSNLYNEYFSGGMSGIVFQELREARGLAYSAYGFNATPNRIGGNFLNIGKIGCQSDKVIEALTTFIELFEQTPNQPKRYAESKDSTLQKFKTKRVNFREIAETHIYWRRKGIEGNLNKLLSKSTLAMEFKDLQQFHIDHIKGRSKRISIVGDRTKIDMEALKKLGPVLEVTKETIFSK